MGCAGPCGDVLEFGCGYGTFTLPAASLVGGKVFALDIEPAMIAATTKKLTEAGLSNAVLEQRDFLATGSGLPDASIGYAMLFNILHVENPVGLLSETYRVLKPSGVAGIIHWKHDASTPRGPSLEIRPRPEQCIAWGRAAGFELVREEALCCCAWHYGLVMRKSPP